MSTWRQRLGEIIAGEMTGKKDDHFSMFTGRHTFYNTKSTVNYARNDYDLFRAIYHASVIDGKGKEYQLGAVLGKPIINSAAGFVIGTGFSVEVTDSNADEQPEAVEDAQQSINDWVKKNKAQIFDYAKHAYRDGDAYFYMDEFGNLDELDAKNVSVVLSPDTGEVVGYDVEEVYEILSNPSVGAKEEYVVVKQYRRDSVKYTKYKTNDTTRSNGTVIYSVVYTEDGNVDMTAQENANRQFTADELQERPLPVVHYANDQEPRAIYGNSDFQNILVLFKHYHAVMSHATEGVIYNSTPIPVLKGVTDANALASSTKDGTDTTDKSKLTWGQDNVLYLNGQYADAKFLQASTFMEDVGKLLEYFFLLIVEGSETPEFVFGAAIASSRASTETQLPVMLQKAERKRTQLGEVLEKLVRLYIHRQIGISNTDFLAIKDMNLDVNIVFPDLVSEDRTLTKDTVDMLLTNGLISDKTALSLLMDTKIPDVEQELKDAAKDNEARAKRNMIIPEDGDDTNRDEDELNEDEPTDEE